MSLIQRHDEKLPHKDADLEAWLAEQNKKPMTAERIADLKQVADTPKKWEKFDLGLWLKECLKEIERLRATNQEEK